MLEHPQLTQLEENDLLAPLNDIERIGQHADATSDIIITIKYKKHGYHPIMEGLP
jgi:hypothetical protein